MRVVRVPVEALLAQWHTEQTSDVPASTSNDSAVDTSKTDNENNVDTGTDKTRDKTETAVDGQELSRLVFKAVLDLRTCNTQASMQKASLQVCTRMLDIVPHARNPFLCMQQASMFAHQCSKGGHSDDPFKTLLPDKHQCTPQQALKILARADCLQAVHFPKQASFLCSYVARVCCLHRDKLETGLSWSPRWKVIGICAFNISMAIRSAAFTSLKKEEAQKLLDDWDMEVVAELERCRMDAVNVKKVYLRQIGQQDEDEVDDKTESDDDDDDGDDSGDSEANDEAYKTTDLAEQGELQQHELQAHQPLDVDASEDVFIGTNADVDTFTPALLSDPIHHHSLDEDDEPTNVIAI